MVLKLRQERQREGISKQYCYITMKTNTFINFMIENNKKIHIFSSIEGVIVKTYE